MTFTTHSYTTTQRRQAAERVSALIAAGQFDVEYHDLGRVYSDLGEEPQLRLLAVCLGRLGMATQLVRDVYGESLHVCWNQAAWDAAW